MTKYEVAIFLLAGCIIGLIIYNVQRSQSQKQMAQRALYLANKKAAPIVQEEKVQEVTVVEAELPKIEVVPEIKEEVAKIEEVVKKVKKASWIDTNESPESAFPTMDSEDKDSELAQAYTYENLQDSMLNRGSSVRGSKNENFDNIKSEILASGQSFEEFKENSWAPIPDKLSKIWKETATVKKIKPTRAALSEAASLSMDSTQNVNLKSNEDTMKSLHDILSAKKRGKALGLTLPGLTPEQITAFAKLESEKSFNGLIRTIKSF